LLQEYLKKIITYFLKNRFSQEEAQARLICNKKNPKQIFTQIKTAVLSDHAERNHKAAKGAVCETEQKKRKECS
jgi:hypothetical protein